MKKSVIDIVMKNQARFNTAYELWLEEGAPNTGKNWQIMFECVAFACSNKAKAMLRNKVNIDDVEDKALEACCHIMDVQIHQKHKKIIALGAAVEGPLMNAIWGIKAQREDSVQSLDSILEDKQDRTKIVEAVSNPEEANKEPLFFVDGIGVISDEQMHNSTFVFELDWYKSLNTTSDTELFGSAALPKKRQEETFC